MKSVLHNVWRKNWTGAKISEEEEEEVSRGWMTDTQDLEENELIPLHHLPTFVNRSLLIVSVSPVWRHTFGSNRDQENFVFLSFRFISWENQLVETWNSIRVTTLSSKNDVHKSQVCVRSLHAVHKDYAAFEHFPFKAASPVFYFTLFWEQKDLRRLSLREILQSWLLCSSRMSHL